MSLKRDIERKINGGFEKIKKRYVKALDETKEIMRDTTYLDLVKIFDNSIDEFYRYQTVQYSRHGEGRGTGRGINLYRANQIKKTGKYGLSVKFDSTDMEGYRPYHINSSEENIYVDKEFVLDNVFSGIRFPETKYKDAMTFSLKNISIKTLICGKLNRSTLDGIYNQYINTWNKKSKKYAMQIFNKCLKEQER